jgi:hypothetical protein
MCRIQKFYVVSYLCELFNVLLLNSTKRFYNWHEAPNLNSRGPELSSNVTFTSFHRSKFYLSDTFYISDTDMATEETRGCIQTN